jgi:hypothetical protein
LFAEQGAAANTAPLLFLAHEPNLFTIITATESANHTLEAQIETLGRLGTLNSKRDLLQVIADADTCSSGVALALAKQIVRYMNRGSNISLEPFSHENIRVATDALAYLQPAAATSLENIVATGNANGDAQITITAALRTVAQQFLLYNFYLTNDDCRGDSIATPALPGFSNHEHGLAIDLSKRLGSNAEWSDELTQSGDWSWCGSLNCADPVHFLFQGAVTERDTRVSLRAFQRLWDCNHPMDRICAEAPDPTTGLSSKTEDRLGRTSTAGFVSAEACPCQWGPYKVYVRENVALDHNVKFDIDNDGDTENRLHAILATMQSQGIDILTFNRRSPLVPAELYAVQASNAENANCAAIELIPHGVLDSVTINDAVTLDGTIQDGKFESGSNARAGAIQTAFMIGSNAVRFSIPNPRTEFSPRDGLLVVGGGVPVAEFLLAWGAALSAFANASTGDTRETLFSLFDTNNDGQVSDREVSDSSFSKTLWAPDLDLMNADGQPGSDGLMESVSVAFGIEVSEVPFQHPCDWQ